MLQFLRLLFLGHLTVGEAEVVYNMTIIYSVSMLSLVLLYKLLSRKQDDEPKTPQEAPEDSLPSTSSALKLMKARRSVKPKDMSGELLTREDVEQVLEAANWAPSHNGTEPWRFAVVEGREGLSEYLDIIETWYSDHKEEIPDREYSRFLGKMSDARNTWVSKASHLVVLGMVREPVQGKRNVEWEEVAAVASSVQNLHLALTTVEGAGGFWSSHSFCMRARDSKEFREFLGMEGEEDRVLGAFVMGKTLPGKKFKGHRRDLNDKVVWK